MTPEQFAAEWRRITALESPPSREQLETEAQARARLTAEVNAEMDAYEAGQ